MAAKAGVASKLATQRNAYEAELARAYAEIDALRAQAQGAGGERLTHASVTTDSDGEDGATGTETSLNGVLLPDTQLRRTLAPLSVNSESRTVSGITVGVPREISNLSRMGSDLMRTSDRGSRDRTP